MEEPSVLDYLKSILFPWKYGGIEIPGGSSEDEIRSPGVLEQQTHRQEITERKQKPLDATPEGVILQPHGASAPMIQPAIAENVESQKVGIPWRGVGVLAFALFAQFIFHPGPEHGDWKLGVILLVTSMAFLVWAVLANEVHLKPLPPESGEADSGTIHMSYLLIGYVVALFAFFTFGYLEFTFLNLSLLGLAILFVVSGFWIKPYSQANRSDTGGLLKKLQRIPRLPWKVNIRISTVVMLASIALVMFFRFYRLDSVPPEMNSDHAEKFLDVLRILSGQTLIFFPSNGGREALQFYFVAGLHKFLGLPLDFMILKLVTASIGFLALPFIYLIGKELGSPRVGLLAFVFAGVAYWPNVVSRVGLRLPFYMFFTAAVFYYLMRGLRQAKRNDFILAGIFLGLGLYGYSGDRILPVLVIAAIGVYLIHRQSRQRRRFGLISLAVVIAVSFVIFIPLLHYILAEPEGFFMRMFTRMGTWEKPITDPVWLIFIQNVGRALAMFSWDAGVVWPISIPGYPALSTVSGGLFYIGVGLVLLRYFQSRNWVDLFLLISIPILMLPSTLALAFPDENPNLYRTGGAIVPVFLFIAIGLDGLMRAFESNKNSAGASSRIGTRISVGLAILLIGINCWQDYGLVFERYYASYRLSAWNSSEMGKVVQNFINLHQAPDNVWVVGYPNWVDTRLVANNAGFPGRDYELRLENIPATASHTGPKIFLLNPQDQDGQTILQQTYPKGWFQSYVSQVETKDFMILFVPPDSKGP